MENLFSEDKAKSTEVTSQTWSERPLPDRIREWSARLFSYWL